MKLKTLPLLLLVLWCASTAGCVGAVVGAAADVAIEVAKVPFKVGGAVVDVVSGDDEDDEDE